MITRAHISLVLAIQLLLTAGLGANTLCLCADLCLEISAATAESGGADECCSEEHAQPESDGWLIADDSCCEICAPLRGSMDPRLPGDSPAVKSLATPMEALPDVSLPEPKSTLWTADMLAAMPPPDAAHLRTVRLIL